MFLLLLLLLLLFFVAVEMFALPLLSCLLLHSAAGAGLCKVVVFCHPFFLR